MGLLLGGLLISAVGITMMLQANIGLEPWSVLQNGMSLFFGMTYGTAALLCVAAEDSGPYDRYLELYLRALTHAGGTPYRRHDLLGEVSAL